MIVVTIGLVALAGCGGGDPTATPTTVASGEALFRSNGCATCHGAMGGGTDAAPSILHHTLNRVLTQVRTPTGTMPTFDVAALSDDDVHLIADFIGGLEGVDHGHEEPDHGDEHAH